MADNKGTIVTNSKSRSSSSNLVADLHQIDGNYFNLL